MVTAMATWTTNAAAAPSQTEKGWPRVAMTSEANMVLSGSSPMKMTGKTAAAMARFTSTFLAGPKGCPRPGHDDMAGTKVSPTCEQVR